MSLSSAFISYHRNDKIIGEAIYDELSFLASHGQHGRNALKCFLDTRDIKKGTPWKPAIDDALRHTNWLIVIFTGDQSAYCGYEIGTFSQVIQQEMGLQENTPLDRKIVGLHDVNIDRLPVILKETENVFVSDVIAADQNNVVLAAKESATWYKSDVGRFLKEFCEHNRLYSPEDEDNPQKYTNNIALSAKKIANAFALARGTDVKSETPAQVSFELTIKGAGRGAFDKIPDGAIIVGTSLFFKILGLAVSLDLENRLPPSITWHKLRALLTQSNGKDVPWMHKVEADIVNASNNKDVNGNDVSFRGSDRRIYRPILERHREYMNGDRRFYLMFVETIDRRFTGSPRTSLLLACLILASRWRFMYLENWQETERIFSEDASLETFTVACRQLRYNIDWIERESAELGADNQQAMVEAFGEHRRAQVEQFFHVWDLDKAKLLKSLHMSSADITAGDQKVIGKAVLDFLRSTRKQNVEFLELAVRVYGEVTKIFTETNHGMHVSPGIAVSEAAE